VASFLLSLPAMLPATEPDAQGAVLPASSEIPIEIPRVIDIEIPHAIDGEPDDPIRVADADGTVDASGDDAPTGPTKIAPITLGYEGSD